MATRQSKARILFGIAFLSGFAMFFSAISLQRSGEGADIEQYLALAVVIATILIVTSSTVLVYDYLRSGLSKRDVGVSAGQTRSELGVEEFSQRVFSRLAIIEKLVGNTSDQTLQSEMFSHAPDSDDHLHKASESVSTNEARSQGAREAREIAIEELQGHGQRRHIMFFWRNVQKRLGYESQSLLRRANANLTFGVVFSMMGILFAMSQVFLYFPRDMRTELKAVAVAPTDVGKGAMSADHANGPDTDPPRNALQYVASASTVLLIEVLAYFFLRLYRSSMSDLKQYQYALTALEGKLIALSVCTYDPNQFNPSAAIAQLAGMEIDQLLSRGESTRSIEEQRIRDNDIQGVLSKLKELLIK